MREATIITHAVRATADRRAVEVIATLKAGEILPGMFVHVPLNGMLNFTVPVLSVSPALDGNVRLLLDCGDEGGDVDIVLAFNFSDETLRVSEMGER